MNHDKIGTNRSVVYFHFYRESQSSSNSHEPWVSACCCCCCCFEVFLYFLTLTYQHRCKIYLITNVRRLFHIAQTFKAVFICWFGA